MPGGKVGVNSGLIDLAAGNEDEIAAVMGHEIAHVALRHSNKRMSQAIGLGVGGVILDVALRNKLYRACWAVLLTGWDQQWV